MDLLILAYGILFLPAAVGAVRTSLLQASPRLEEAARSLGRTPLQVFISITLPVVRPGILAGASLVFLLTMKELPATLILSPIGFKTLATSIWGAASEAFFAQAAAPALLLILASSVPLAFLILWERR
jgi:iron(III) transport system permease protein